MTHPERHVMPASGLRLSGIRTMLLTTLAKRRTVGIQHGRHSISDNYRIVDNIELYTQEADGWQEPAVAGDQDRAYRALVQEMFAGKPRQDLVVAAEAVRRTALEDPLILEIGCGSGYYSETLPYLLNQSVRYTGLDYSRAMINLAIKNYSDRPFIVGDGVTLPFIDKAYDIVLNGVSLMHILRYEAAILESRRVARHWCIFHTVPVLQRRQTTILHKRAYGQPTFEVIFNEGELRHLFTQSNLEVRSVLESIPYNLQGVLGEPTITRTYVCKV